jgi:antitoxin HicB
MRHGPYIGHQDADRSRSSHQEGSHSARHPEVRAKRASKGDGPDRASGATDEPPIPDDLLKKEGEPQAFEAAAIKEALASQIAEAMKAQNLSRKRLAERMKTSRSQIRRLLDPKDGNVTIATLQRAAKVVGGTLRLELVQVQSREDGVEII